MTSNSNSLTTRDDKSATALARLKASEYNWLLSEGRYEFGIVHRAIGKVRLPTPDEEAELRRLVAASLEPADRNVLRTRLARLVDSFPQRGPEHPEGYLLSLVEHLQGYPSDVIEKMAWEAVETFKFLPAISELVEIAKAAMAPRHAAESALNEIPEERERRKREAEVRAEKERREAEWAARERRAEDLYVELRVAAGEREPEARRSWTRLGYGRAQSDVIRRLEQRMEGVPEEVSGCEEHVTYDVPMPTEGASTNETTS